MTEIDFDHLKSYFDPERWDIGVLDGFETVQCCLQPNRMQKSAPYGVAYDAGSRELIESETHHTLVIIRKADYSQDYAMLNYESRKIMTDIFGEDDLSWTNPPAIETEVPVVNSIWYTLWLNSKAAAITANLGVRAKNSMVHTYKFGFHAKIATYGIRIPITNYKREQVKTDLLDACLTCNLCVESCPVKAIHPEPPFPFIDLFACHDQLAKTSRKNWKHDLEYNNTGKLVSPLEKGYNMCNICQTQQPCNTNIIKELIK